MNLMTVFWSMAAAWWQSGRGRIPAGGRRSNGGRPVRRGIAPGRSEAWARLRREEERQRPQEGRN